MIIILKLFLIEFNKKSINQQTKNMKKLLLLLVFTSSLFAQNAPNLTFANKENNVGFGGNLLVDKTVKDASGNNYLFGRFSGIADFDPSTAETNLTSINFQFGDMFIAKYNSNGDFLWVKNITGSGYANCSAVVIGGNFIYIAGKYTSTIDFDPSASTANLTSANGTYEAAYLAKYDLNGAYLSSRSIDGDTNLKINGLNFSNNQLFVSGNYSGAVDFDSSTNTLNLISNGGTDIFIAKYSTLFAPLWVYSIGGVGNDICNSQAVTSTGEVIISGSYLNTVDFDPSTATNTLVSGSSTIQNTYIAKYSTSGAYVWAKDIGARRLGSVGSLPVITLDASNNILVAGIFNQTSDFDPSSTTVSISAIYSNTTFIAKYDGNGNYVWVKTLNNISNKGIILNNSNNNTTIFGTFSSSTTSDFDPGTPVFNLDTTIGTNYFATYDSNGNFVYAKNMKATITNVINNDTQGIYLTGNFSGTNDFDPSAGVATQFSVLSNGFIAKYDTTGAYGYVKPIGGNKPSNQTFNLISTDGAGNIYRVGTLSATTDLDPSSNTFNVSSPSGTGIFISKYSPSGSFIWGNTMPGSLGTALGISVMNTDTNGNTYVIGRADANGVLSSFMLKYDSNGNNLWTKQINGAIYANRRIVFDSQGNYYVAGTISGATAIDFDPSPFGTNLLNPNNLQLVFIAKYSPQGEHIWAKTIAQSGSTSQQVLYDFQINNNSLYVTGYINGGGIIFSPTVSYPNIDFNGFVAKYDLSGNYDISAVFLSNDPNITGGSACSSIAFDNDNNFYVTTYYSGTIDFDVSPTSVYNLVSAIDGTGNYLETYAISKYSINGTLLWAKSINAQNVNSWIYWDTVRSFVNTNNELILTGVSYGSVDFDPSTNNFIIATPNVNGAFVQNIFMAKYNKTTGNFIWANKVDSNTPSYLNSASMTNNQDLLISGQFRETADLDLSTGAQTLTSANPFVYDRFWAKYTTTTLGLEQNAILNNYRIYPNPTSAELFVSHTQYDVFKITITDITGKVLKETTIHANEAIDVKSYPQGMYLIQVESDKEKNTYKFIKK
jgi:hypothetical protein